MKKVVTLTLLLGISSFLYQLSCLIDPVGAQIPRAPSASATWYVEAGGDSLSSCAKNDPCNFATAYSGALSGDSIYFKQGTYYRDSMGYPIATNYLIWLADKTLNLRGGWDGDPDLGETPNFTVYTTILHGQDTYRPIIITGTSNTSDIFGFKITNGLGEDSFYDNCTAMGAGENARCGGGIYVDSASPTIEYNQIWSNKAVATASGDPLPIGLGGGIYAYGSDAIIIRYNDIQNNYATESGGIGGGGGIVLVSCGSATTVKGNNIWYNHASDSSHTGWGAGMVVDYSANSSDKVEISQNYFGSNNLGGPVTITGTAIKASMSNLDIFDNGFYDNRYGSVIHLSSGVGNLKRNVLNNPEASYGLSIWGGRPLGMTIVINNIIANHTSGNVILTGSVSNPADVFFHYNTVVFMNPLVKSKGFIIEDNVYGTFSHGIIAGHYNGFESIGHSTGTIDINYNLMYSNSNSDYGAFDGIATYKFSGNPQFVDPAFSLVADFHINPNSAARDIGIGMVGLNEDIDFQARPNPPTGSHKADLGADEWWGWFLPIILK